jgi:hypothetical protein
MNFHFFQNQWCGKCQPRIQISNLNLCFYWNESFVFTLMNTLKYNWNSPLDCVVSLFNTSCNPNVTNKKKLNHVQCMHLKKWKKLKMFLLVRFCFHPLQYLLQKLNKFLTLKWDFLFCLTFTSNVRCSRKSMFLLWKVMLLKIS